MAPEAMGRVQAQQHLENGLKPLHQLVFPASFTSGGPAPQLRSDTAAVDVPGLNTNRELTTGYINHRHNYFHHHQPTEFRRTIFAGNHRSSLQVSGHNRSSTTPSGEGSEDDDVEDEGVFSADRTINSNKKIVNDNANDSDDIVYQKTKHLSSFGLKEVNVVEQSGNEGSSDMRNATMTTTDGGIYYHPQCLQGTEGSNGGQRDMVVENGVGFSGRKDGFYSSESRDSLRAILSDPLTGVLMDDAMILPCGHSFGSGGMQHVLRMRACHTCSHAVTEDLVAPNLSLRTAVQAFRREEDLHVSRAPKRKKERYDQDTGIHGYSIPSDQPRGRGLQFPFAVTDRVIIQGNKRTPQRFVGREAIVTTQCLNGWYVVKTLDNAESVKLQYRSLSKAQDNQSSKPMSSKATPHWL